jgi:rhodanese-related sulfurtransferase
VRIGTGAPRYAEAMPIGPEAEVSPQRARELVEAGASLIDVRRDDEVGDRRIEGSRHIALEQVAGAADSIDRETPVVFYCRVGSRSAMATEAYRAAGYEAYNLAGGINGWIETGLPVDSG